MKGLPAELEPFAALLELDVAYEAGDVDGVDTFAAGELDELRSLLAGRPAEHESRGGGPGRHEQPQVPLSIELDASSAWPIGRSCSTHYRAIRNSGIRRLSSIELGVVHCTQGPTAVSAAAWFVNPAAQGSAHVVADAAECYRTLPPSVIPWGAPGVNGVGWHLELAGYAEWSRTEWLHHRGTLERGAYKLAQNGAGRFPMRQLSDRQLVDVLRRSPHRVRGIVSHRQVTRVYGGTHTDPGAHFPYDVFMGYARHFEQQLAR